MIKLGGLFFQSRSFSLTGRLLKEISKMAFQPVVLCGPSGSGKSTLLKKLMGEYPNAFAFSVSHTTRSPRPGEEHGREYFFVSRDEMEQKVKNNEFVEHACFSGNMYGTSKETIKDIQQLGKICVLDVDTQGVKSIKNTDLNPRYIYIKPPSFEILETRLRGRGTETEEAVQKRLNTAKLEMEYCESPGVFDHIIVNDDLELASEKLKGILIKDLEASQK